MKTKSIPARVRVSFLPGVAAACGAALVSGCMSSPTYGTGKTANAQLLEDITGVISTDTLMASQSRGSEIAYTPRGELVRPESLEVLPEPQQDIVTAGNPAWPESPEQRRARIRAEATANRESASFRTAVAVPEGSVVEDTGPRIPLTGPEAALNRPSAGPSMQEVAMRRQQQATAKQGSPNVRRYLSEPPVEYRVPEATAPVGEIGQDEWEKERAAKRAGGKSSWRDWIPGL